jgi:hypothetical protein
MPATDFYQAILDTLEGRSDALRPIPPERLDWAGPGAFLELYRSTSGSERTALITAIGKVIEDHPAPAPVLAQLIQIASSLDMAEVEPQVRKLRANAIASQEPLHGAITNYLAFRNLNTPLSRARTGNRDTNSRKTRSTRDGNGKTGTA